MKYRKKPVEIEAYQMNALNDASMPSWITDAISHGIIYRKDNELYIKTLEGDHHISRGDYVIKGVKGELYPCKPDIFKMTYEPVSEEYINPNIPNKYIYELRMEDDFVYVRKYPVIYENKEYVYFKTQRARALGLTSQTSVYQNSSKAISELARLANLVSYSRHAYCWEDPGHTKDDREKFQKMILARKAIAENLKQTQDELNKVQRMYQNLQERREDLQERVLSLEKELTSLEDLEGIDSTEEDRLTER